MTNPIEELESFLNQLEVDESSKTNIEHQISIITSQLNSLKNQKDSLQKKIYENRSKKSALTRAAALYEEEERINKEINKSKDELLALIDGVAYPLPPKDHQVNGAVQLAVAGKGMCTDRRGLGKTLTSFIWTRMVQSKKTLVMTRNKYVPKMEREMRFWEPERTILNLAGFSRHEREAIYPMLSKAAEFTVILNYEAWRKDRSIITHLRSLKFDAVVLDEIHNAKSARTAVAKGLKEFVPKIKYILEMTGTPFLNRPQEVWFPLHLIYPDLFPTEREFLEDYCIPWGPNDWRWQAGGAEKLAQKLKPFYVSRTRKSVGVEIPPPSVEVYDLNFNEHPKQLKAYSLLTERAMAKLESGKVFDLPSILSILARQRQMVVWPAGIEFKDVDLDTGEVLDTYRFDVYESVKLDWSEDFIKDLLDEDENSRIVLGSNFKEPIWELERRLRRLGIRVATYTGETSPHQAALIEHDFDLKTAPEVPKYQVLLATYQTIGEALDLNAAGDAIILDRQWNFGREDQFVGRVDRMNNTSQARIHIPEVKGSVDVFMSNLVERKRDIMKGFSSAHELQDMMIKAHKDGEL